MARPQRLLTTPPSPSWLPASHLIRFAACVLITLSALTVSLVAADTPQDVAKLIAQLKDPNEAIRLKAAKELGKLKEKAQSATEALAKVAAGDPDEDVRAVAKKALAAIRESIAEADKEMDKELVAPMLKGLKSKKATERTSALEELARMGEKARPATSAIVEAMVDSTPAVREAAAGCLEKVDPTIHKQVVSILYDDTLAKQKEAIAQLAALGARAKGAVPILKYRYGNPIKIPFTTGRGVPTIDYALYEALEALVKIAPDDALTVGEVLRLVSQPVPVFPVRNAPAQAAQRAAEQGRATGLRLIGAVEATKAKKVTALVAALEDPANRVAAIGLLGNFGPDAKPALPALMRLKLDGVAAVREAATRAIDVIQAE